MRPPLLAAALLTLASGCAMFEPSLPSLPQEGFRWSEDYVEVSALGKADPGISNDTERRAISRQAAMTVAQARLQAYAERIKVPGRGTVGALAARDPDWARRLRQALLGAETANTTWSEDGSSATVVLRESRASLESLRNP